MLENSIVGLGGKPNFIFNSILKWLSKNISYISNTFIKNLLANLASE